MIKEYIPKPIDTSAVELSEEIVALSTCAGAPAISHVAGADGLWVQYPRLTTMGKTTTCASTAA